MSRNKIHKLSIPLLLAGLFVLFSAQTKKEHLEEDGYVLFSDGRYTDSISVEKFLINMGKPLSVVNNANDTYSVVNYRFSYAERGLYEDPTGKPFIDAEYLTGFYESKMDTPMLMEMFRRAKPGDTAYIEEVKYIVPAKTKGAKPFVYKSKPLKIFLTR